MAAGPSREVSFNKPYLTGRELDYIRQAHENMHLSGDGPFTKRCQAWLKERIGAGAVLLTHSCTAALEMAAILLDFGPGDEVVMPSFTFVSTANAVVLRGGVPVFVDIRPDTLKSTRPWSRPPSRRARGRSCRCIMPAFRPRWTHSTWSRDGMG